MGFAEILKKDRATWNEILDLCERTSKKPLEVIREGTQYVRRQNEEKYEEMMNNNTPYEKRILIFSELFLDDFGLALTGNINPYSPFRRRRR